MEAEPLQKIQVVEDAWATIRHIIEAVAIVAAGLWAFYTFIYQERIKPASEPAALSETLTVTRLGRDATRDILGITLSYHNAGKTEIDIAADGFDVSCVRFANRAKRFDRSVPDRIDRGTDVPIASRQLIRAFAELRDGAVGGRPGTHIILEPGDTDSNSDVVTVARGAYDLVDVQMIAVPFKTSLGHKVHVRIQRESGGGIFLTTPDAGIEEDDTTASLALIP